MFGFVTWLNGALIPFLQIACELTHLEAYFVTLAFYIAYTVTALPMSLILKRTGYRNGMVLGLAVMVVGSLLFIPAALLRTYSLFLLALFVLGTGLTILQTASNPYIVMIGPHETAAVRISIMGVLNKAAGVIAPLVFSTLVLADISRFTDERLATLDTAARGAELVELSSRLVVPYCLMAGLLLVLGLLIWWSPLPEPAADETPQPAAARGGVLRRPQLVLGALTLFFYVGIEVIAGDTIGLFGKSLGVPDFGGLTAYTMSFMVIGYLLGMLAIPRWITQERALLVSACVGIALAVLLLNTSAESQAVGAWLASFTPLPVLPDVILYVALFGLANALVWPAVWPLALKDLSREEAAVGSALLIMGIAGGALLPLVYGALADALGDPRQAYAVAIPCYVVIAFYALRGHRLRHWRAS